MRRFAKVYVELTSQCNLACSFCPSTQRQNDFMPVELFTKIAAELAGKCQALYFHIMGEALLHPAFDQILALCHNYQQHGVLSTNGQLLSAHSQLLLNSPALKQINISLHSNETELDSSASQKYWQIISDFLSAAQSQSHHPIIHLRLWNYSDQTQTDPNRAILQRLQDFFGLSGLSASSIGEHRGLALATRIRLVLAERFEWPTLPLGQESVSLAPQSGFCHGLRDQLAICCDGSVLPCCLDHRAALKLGSVLDSSLQTILDSPRAQALLNAFRQRRVIESLCQTCSYRLRFNRL